MYKMGSMWYAHLVHIISVYKCSKLTRVLLYLQKFVRTYINDNHLNTIPGRAQL